MAAASDPHGESAARSIFGFKTKKSMDWLKNRRTSASGPSTSARPANVSVSSLLGGVFTGRSFPSSPKSCAGTEPSSAESTYFERATSSSEPSSTGDVDGPSEEELRRLESERKQKDAALLKSWLSKDALRRMLDEPRCLWKFGRFLSKEMSAEVLVFWLNAEQHRQDLERLHSFTKRVHALHVPTNAALALNISFRERAEMNSSVQAFMNVEDPYATAREMALEALFRDPWPRFLSHRLALAHQRGLQQMADGQLPVTAKLAKCFTITTLEGDQPIMLASKEFTIVTGYQLTDIIGRNCRFLQGPGTSAEAVDRIRQCLREGRTSHELLLNYTVTGNPFFNLLLTVPLHDASGRVVANLGYQVDVTGLMSRAPNLARLLADELDSDDEHEDEERVETGLPRPNYRQLQQAQVEETIKARLSSQKPVNLRDAAKRSSRKVMHGPTTTSLSRDQRLHEASALAFDATSRQYSRPSSSRASAKPFGSGTPFMVGTPLTPTGRSPSVLSVATQGMSAGGLGLSGLPRGSRSRPGSRGDIGTDGEAFSGRGRANSFCSSPRTDPSSGLGLESDVANQEAAVFVVLERDGLSVLYSDPRLSPDIEPGMRTNVAFKHSGDLPSRLSRCARTGESFAVACPVSLGGLFAPSGPGSPRPEKTPSIVVAGTTVRDARNQCGAVVVLLELGANARMNPLPARD